MEREFSMKREIRCPREEEKYISAQNALREAFEKWQRLAVQGLENQDVSQEQTKKQNDAWALVVKRGEEAQNAFMMWDACMRMKALSK
jgi:uncharacterized protein (DUF608 family)